MSRRLGALLAALYLITIHLPGVLVLAAPQYFSRPGAGVNATPLDVLSFSGGEFGEVSDAVNLVNGNVYLDLGAISRNNTLKPGEDTAGSFGNFKTNGILRLAGFSPTMTAVPTEWSLGVGDGSYQVFRRATNPEIDAAPSWIKERYAAIRGGVAFFISKPLAGTQVDEQWIVTYQRGDNRMISHHYSHTGTRTTFLNDGEYADFTQTPHEQYRTAKASNTPDGADGVFGTIKTQFTYLGLNSGRVLRVEDGWGRVTTYQWNPDNTLESVSLLVQNTTDTASWARRIEYAYKDFGGQKMVWYMGFRTFDGRGGFEGRWFSFNYKLVGSAWLLDWVKRPILASGGAGDMGVNQNLTTYNYDGTGRVSNITETNKPVTSFEYGATTNPAAVGGTRVTRTIGLASDANRKVTTYDYTTDGWLRTLTERDYNPVTGVERNPGLATTYWYNATGQLLAVNLASGAQTQSIYDAHGNVLKESMYKTPVNWADPPPAGFVRTKTYKYDADNQLVSDLTPVTPGGDTTTGLYNYGQAEDVTTYTSHPAVTASNQTFKAISASNMLRTVAGVNGNPLGLVTNISEAGLITSQIKSGNGPFDLTTSYTYYGNRATSTELKAANFLQATLPATGSSVVYGDMVSAKTEQGVDSRVEEYAYDRAGNLSRTTKRRSNAYKYIGGNPQYADTESWTTLNGWGQPVFQLVRERRSDTDIQDVQAKGWNYRPSGELTASWEGAPTKLTLYTVNASTGRVDKVEEGPGNGLTLTAVRARTQFGYDAFSRISSVRVNNNTTETTFDTLDREVKIITPDNGKTVTTYARSGGVQSSTLTELDGTTISTSSVRDTLNRETSRTFPNGATVTTAYDAFDRPIAITDNRLTMLGNAQDRTTFMRYDNQGNLIKQLDPALATDPSVTYGSSYAYIDSRRPYTEWTYDNWGRRTNQKVLLTGTVTPSNLAIPAGAAVASTTTEYDVFGRARMITDAEDYTTYLYYDGDDNLIQTVQTVWKTSEPGYADSANGFTSVSVRSNYDAVGRQTLRTDGRGNTSVTAYDILGNITALKDGRGIVTKRMIYTPDGLLERTYEPDNSSSTQSSSLTDLSGYVMTEFNRYPDSGSADSGDGTKPTTTWRAHMNTQAGLYSGAQTDYTYDYAGRVILTGLPADQNGYPAALTYIYDAQGHLTYQRDANGFITRSTYNAQGLLASTVAELRPGGVDSAAFPNNPNGLTSSYQYDPADNLISKNERGLVTQYRYNSLGKVVLEGRPKTDTSTIFKYSAYRLDGLPTAKTSYTYDGSLRTNLNVSSVNDTAVTVTSGNLTLMEYNRRGDLIAEKSRAPSRVESTKTLQVNGLGQRYRRAFWGHSNIYAEQKADYRTPLGHANYISVWKFDANGNLTNKWDTPMNGTTGSVMDANDKQNPFYYIYNSANQETYQSRTVYIVQKSVVSGNLLTTNYGGSQGVIFAASEANTNTTYTERGQIEKSTSSDTAPVLINRGSIPPTENNVTRLPNRHQSYAYYFDSRVQTSSTGDGTTNQAYKEITYDQRGREIGAYDSNGGRINKAGGQVTTNYAVDGTITITGIQGGATTLSQTQKPTVGGLSAYSSATGQETVSYIYGAGVLQDAIKTTNGASTRNYTYNWFGENTSTTDSTVGYTLTTGYDSDGYITWKPGESGTTESYSLDSRGNRLTVTGGIRSGYQKRYNADDVMAQFFLPQSGTDFCSPFGGCSSVGQLYNDFRYDPFGQLALTSTGKIIEQTDSGYTDEHAIFRDFVSTIFVQGQAQMSTNGAGFVMNDCGRSLSYYCNLTNTYTSNGFQYRDASYSVLDGGSDTVAWSGTAPFAIVRPVQALDAPVQSLSGLLRINPLDVVTQGLPNLPDPAQITGNAVEPKDAPQEVTAGADQGQKQATVAGPVLPGQDQKVSNSQQQATAETSVAAQEVAPEFNDGRGFASPIYAVQAQGTSGSGNSWWKKFAAWVGDHDAQMKENYAEQTKQQEKEAKEAAQTVMNTVMKVYGAESGTHVSELSRFLKENNVPASVKIAYFVTLQQGIIEGKITQSDLQELAHSVHVSESSTGVTKVAATALVYFSPLVKTYGAEAASLMADMIPILGPAKAIFEAISGKDIFTGEELSGGGRAMNVFMSMLGPIAKAGSKSEAVLKVVNKFRESLAGGKKVIHDLKASAARFVQKTCKLNSFAPSTPVRTLSGLVAISALSLGTPVLAFNEQTGENGYYPITAVHKNIDPDITYLTINDPEQGNKSEFIETTPEHPFYLSANVDASPRPQPEGHADLNVKWVGAGHLKIGDKIRQADGTLGVIANVVTVQQTQEMFNLTVDEAHTFYVGEQGWLVHNCDDRLLQQANAQRDKLAQSVAGFPNKSRPATVVGAYDPKTGRVVAACSNGAGKCAEDVAVDILGIPRNQIRFTEAVRPRNGDIIPVCTSCQLKYSDNQFPPGTRFQGR